MTRRGGRFWGFIEDGLVVGFFIAIGVVGILGVSGLVSRSAEEVLPDFTAIVLWCGTYFLGMVLGVLGRICKWYPVEGVGLIAVALATILQGYALVAAGAAGTQTGVRLFAGVLLIFANALLAFRAARAEPLERVVAQVLNERMAEARDGKEGR